jgi:hypothetical protein
MAAQYDTIGIHKLSCWVEMQFIKKQCCYQGTAIDEPARKKSRLQSAVGSVLGSIPKLGFLKVGRREGQRFLGNSHAHAI